MSDPASMLFVCTGNICRSPMGERIARGYVEKAGLPVTVTSAGTQGLNGYPMHEFAASVLGDYGFDADGFTARYLQPQILKDADLVLCLTRAHRAACQKLVPVRWKRMFTLIEFAELTPAGTLEEIMGARNRVDPNSKHLDIADPMGRPREDFERVYSEIEPQVRLVVDWMARQE